MMKRIFVICLALLMLLSVTGCGKHEEKYTALGIPIKFGLFRMGPKASDFDPTRFRITPGVRKEAVRRLKDRYEMHKERE